MKLRNEKYCRLFPYCIYLLVLLFAGLYSSGQQKPSSRYGIYDTIIVPFVIYQGDTIPARELEMFVVKAPAPPAMAARLKEWTRLRNAVYVTYPYARKAGAIMNDMNAKMVNMKQQHQRKVYLKSRENELKKEFTQPLTNLSVYQGRILMKLINRQTGNNCYEIIKEYKGGITARVYQTVAFFFNSNLKQPYDAQGEDRVIEQIVLEVERMYGKR